MQYNGLFVGLTTIDIQYFVDTFPVSNSKVKTNAPDILVGGPATNAAVAFAKLNNGAFLASPAGKNSFADIISADFDQTKINHFDLIKEQTANPVIASVVTAKNGDRNIFTHHPDLIQSDITVQELFEKIKPQIVMLDGFYPEFSKACAKLAKNRNIPVVMDCGSWKPQYNTLLEYVDIAICSEDFYPPQCDNSDQVFKFMQEKGIDKIAISRGEKSILYLDKKRGEVPVEKSKVVDTLGAGDFLHGAFCFYYFQCGEFENSLKLAAAVASYTCKFKGTRDWLYNFPK
jgi:sugar/nucleoside kinase (ribokinase family)